MDTQIEVAAPAPKRQPKALAIVTPSAMITQAIASGAGVEVMEKLMALHERWEAMQARKAFDDAMSKLRENMPTVVKNQKVDYENKSADDNGVKGRVNYKYEDLSDVTEALSPVMSGLGLSFRWRTENVQGGVKVTCVLTHRDGHAEETSLVGPLDASGKKNPLQAIGSAVTYLQRYTLKAAVGVAASKDDDGIAAGQQADAPAATRSAAPVKFTGRAEKAELALRAAKSVTDLEAVWEKVKTVPADQIPDEQYSALARLADELVKGLPKVAPKSDDDFPGDMPAVDPNAQFDRMESAA